MQDLYLEFLCCFITWVKDRSVYFMTACHSFMWLKTFSFFFFLNAKGTIITQAWLPSKAEQQRLVSLIGHVSRCFTHNNNARYYDVATHAVRGTEIILIRQVDNCNASVLVVLCREGTNTGTAVSHLILLPGQTRKPKVQSRKSLLN